jgi:hypothetical protein
VNDIFINCRQDGSIETSDNGIKWKNISNDNIQGFLDDLKKKKNIGIVYSRDNSLKQPTDFQTHFFNILVNASFPIKLVRQKGSDGSGEEESNDEGNYTNCLLVTLAKSKGATVFLESGYGVPALEGLNKNQNELPWILGLPFDYQKLSSDTVIGIILKVMNNPSVEQLEKGQVFNTRMVLSKGKSENVFFEFKQIQGEGKMCFELKRVK